MLFPKIIDVNGIGLDLDLSKAAGAKWTYQRHKAICKDFVKWMENVMLVFKFPQGCFITDVSVSLMR